MKKNKKRKTNNPNLLLYFFLVWLLKLFSFLKGRRFEGKKIIIKGPAITLSNHTTWFDFAYTVGAIYPRRARGVAAEKMFYDHKMGFFLKISKTIPKKLYDSDTKTVMEVLRALRDKQIIMIFPEGQISCTGHPLHIGKAIVKLIKTANVDVYLIKHKAACFESPAWSKCSFPGKFYTETRLLLSKEQIKDTNDEEIFTLIKDALYIEPYEYAKEKNLFFKVKNIKNLETVLCECVKCHSLNIINKKKFLHCNDCGYDAIYDKQGFLDKQTIPSLYISQRNRIQKKYENDSAYKLASSVILEGYVDKKLKTIGHGYLELSGEGYLYKGIIYGEEKTLIIPISSVSSLPSDLGYNIQIYFQNVFYQFRFSERYYPILFVMFGEILFEQIVSSNERHGSINFQNND